MKKYARKLISVALALLASGAGATSKEGAATPEGLISQASKLQDIWTLGTPPSRMRAELQIIGAKGEITRGEYIVNWVSPSRWREEIRFDNYSRLRVYDGKGYWQKSGLRFQPEVIFQLDRLLHFGGLVKLGANQVFGKVKSHDKDGVRQSCADVKWPNATERILCFDEANGNLSSVEYPRLENLNPPEISRIEYGAFTKVGEKRVPFEMRALRDRKVVIAARVLELVAATDEGEALFAVPEGSEFWPKCDGMRDATLKTHIHPQYPPSARSNREQGRVIFYTVIEADGSLSHLTLIQHATPTLESAAAEAVRQWHYDPAACGSTSVRVETSIYTDFWLQQ